MRLTVPDLPFAFWAVTAAVYLPVGRPRSLSLKALAPALAENLSVRLVIVVVHLLPALAPRLHTPLILRPLTARVIRTLIAAACDTVSFSLVPVLAANRFEPRLTADKVGRCGLMPGGPGGGPEGWLGGATIVLAIAAPHADAAALSDGSPP